MIPQEDVLSALTMQGLYFETLLFKSNGQQVHGTNNIEVSFKLDSPVINDKLLTIKLGCKIKNKDFFEMELSLVGLFNVIGPENPNLFVPNAVSIMFPYLRSQVSLMTAQPNLVPIVLPPININKLLCQTTGKK